MYFFGFSNDLFSGPRNYFIVLFNWVWPFILEHSRAYSEFPVLIVASANVNIYMKHVSSFSTAMCCRICHTKWANTGWNG